MNIGFDAKRYFNNKTGLGNYSRTLVSNLNTYFPSHNYFLYTPSIELTDESLKLQSLNNFKIRTAGSKNHNLWRTFEIKKDIQKDDIDIYHGLSHELPRSNENMTCKKVVTIHDLIFKTNPEYFPYIDRSFYHIKCKHSLLTSDVIIAISENTKQDIIKFYDVDPEKIKVVYQACHPRFYNHDIIKDALPKSFPSEYILSVGSLEKRKNIGSVIQAYTQLEERFRVPLFLIGNGRKHKKYLQDLINKEKLQKHIHILSNVPSRLLPAIYQNALMLLYPSFYEGFGLPVAEALLSSTPVITSKTSSLPEAGGPSSIYIDPNSIDSLSHEIRSLLTDTEKAEKMAIEGKAYAQKMFDPQQLSNQLMELYSEVSVGSYTL